MRTEKQLKTYVNAKQQSERIGLPSFFAMKMA